MHHPTESIYITANSCTFKFLTSLKPSRGLASIRHRWEDMLVEDQRQPKGNLFAIQIMNNSSFRWNLCEEQRWVGALPFNSSNSSIMSFTAVGSFKSFSSFLKHTKRFYTSFCWCQCIHRFSHGLHHVLFQIRFTCTEQNQSMKTNILDIAHPSNWKIETMKTSTWSCIKLVVYYFWEPLPMHCNGSMPCCSLLCKVTVTLENNAMILA